MSTHVIKFNTIVDMTDREFEALLDSFIPFEEIDAYVIVPQAGE